MENWYCLSSTWQVNWSKENDQRWLTSGPGKQVFGRSYGWNARKVADGRLLFLTLLQLTVLFKNCGSHYTGGWNSARSRCSIFRSSNCWEWEHVDKHRADCQRTDPIQIGHRGRGDSYISESTYYKLRGVNLQKATWSLWGPAGQPLKMVGQFTKKITHTKTKSSSSEVILV